MTHFKKTYSMTDTLPDVNLDPPDDITGEYEEEYDENGNIIELDDEYSPDDLDDSYDGDFESNETFGGRNYP